MTSLLTSHFQLSSYLVIEKMQLVVQKIETLISKKRQKLIILRYLNFCLDFLVMHKNNLIRKIKSLF